MKEQRISNLALKLIGHIHSPEISVRVENLLQKDAALYGPPTSDVIERVQVSVVKIAIEAPSKIEAAEKLYIQDTRDLLVMANFAHTLDAHLKWSKSILGVSDA